MFYSRTQRKNQSFTLIELTVVIAIITILATISIPNVTRYLAKSRDAKRVSDIQVIVLAFESFYDDEGHYPGWLDDNNIGNNGDCLGVVGRTDATVGPCRDISNTERTDGAVDALLRTYIHGPVPRDPLYDHNPDQYYYGYDPTHLYYMPTSVVWSDTFPTGNSAAECIDLTYPNRACPTCPITTSTTAILNVHRFETHTVERHRDDCGGGTLNISTSDYNIALPELGWGSGAVGSGS